MTITEAADRSLEEQFDLFCSASSFESILHHFNRLCAMAVTQPGKHPWTIYTQLTTRLKSYWKAAALFERLEKRIGRPEYMHQTACSGLNVLVVGCGPCGLRCAIELALLGARVVIVEKRDTFSRNNVLHLWPYLIEDLRALGAKTYFGKFCAGAIDHVSIRTLQCILLKAALLFGVQVFVGVSYRGLIEPSSCPTTIKFPLANRVFLEHENTVVSLANGEHHPSLKPPVSCSPSAKSKSGSTDKISSGKSNGLDTVHVCDAADPDAVHPKQQQHGWRAQLEPELTVLTQQYDIDVLIGADGKRSCLGFPSKELRCRLALAITVNFVNYHTPEETQVEEISGVSSIFNQQFFAQFAKDTGIDLENIVYYKDETHYFVMTAKKHSLLAKGVLRQDREDSNSLLSAENVDRAALQAYARETAQYVTSGKLSQLDFALNARGEPDVELFDFTRMFAAEHSCRIVERNQRLLLQCLIGDGLFEPFWPTGSGCALGFLSALDAAWAVSRLASGLHPIQVIAQRESVYQRLSQTTAQNMPTNFAEYALDPRTRYVRCNLNLFSPVQIRHLYSSDALKGTKAHHWHKENGLLKTGSNQIREQLILARTRENHAPKQYCCPLSLLRWFQFRLAFYESFDLIDPVCDLTSARWDSGGNLLCLIHLYRPELVPELEHFFAQQQQHGDDDKDRHRSKLDLRDLLNGQDTVPHPKPSLIRACGLLIEHFNVEFVPDLDTGMSTYPRSTKDWQTYLVQVQQALCRLRIAGPSLLIASPKREKPVTRAPNKSPTTTTKNGARPVPHPPHSQKPEDSVRMNGRVRRVFREDPNWSVEKGLLLKRRTELIATLDPASTKRRSPIPPAQKLREMQLRLSQRQILSHMNLNTFPDRDQPVQAVAPGVGEDESKPAVIRPIAVPENVARLFTPRKGSAHCYACNKRLYLIERLMAFDLFFHRHCFRCSECGVQLQVDKATCVRGNGSSEPDKFYCPSHSQLAPGGPTTGKVNKPRLTGAPSGASLEARLRAGQFPFGPPDRVSTAMDGSRVNSPLTRTQSFSDLIPYNQPPTSLSQPRPLHSALLAGLPGNDDDAEEIMGVVSVPAIVRHFRKSAQMTTDSSSTTSPERRPSVPGNPRRAVVGPGGDSARAQGIRDDSAPGPDCYLAGHLGLPEVERRANWELNQSSAWPTASIPDILEHMKLIRPNIVALDDYFASSESEPLCKMDTDSESRSVVSSTQTEHANGTKGPSPPANTALPHFQRPRRVRVPRNNRKDPLARSRIQPSSVASTTTATRLDDPGISGPNAAQFVSPMAPIYSPSVLPTSSSAAVVDGISSSTTGSAASSVLSSPAHHQPVLSRLAAKQKFCLEPPKPFTIDPKQFVSSRNRDRCVTGELSDCSEVVQTLNSPELHRAYVNSVGSTEPDQVSLNRLRILNDAPLTPTDQCELEAVNKLHPEAPSIPGGPNGGVSLAPTYDGLSDWRENKVAESAMAAAPFASLDEFHDMDSMSTVTERSSAEHTAESDRNPIRQPVTSCLSPFAGDYDNLDSPRQPANGKLLCSYGIREPSKPALYAANELRRRVRSDERLLGGVHRNVAFPRSARSELDETDAGSATTSSADLDSAMSIRPLPGALARIHPNPIVRLRIGSAKPDHTRSHDALRLRCANRSRQTLELTQELESLESKVRQLEMAGVEMERELYSMNPRTVVSHPPVPAYSCSISPNPNPPIPRPSSDRTRSRTLNYNVTYGPSRTVAVSSRSHQRIANPNYRGVSERRYVLLKRLAAMLATKSALLDYASTLSERRDQIQLDELQDVPSESEQSVDSGHLTRCFSEPNLTELLRLEQQPAVSVSPKPVDSLSPQQHGAPASTTTTHDGDVIPSDSTT